MVLPCWVAICLVLLCRTYVDHKYIGDDLAAMLPKDAGVPEVAEALKHRM